MAYGRYLEEFAVGQVLTHWPGRTITEADCTWFPHRGHASTSMSTARRIRSARGTDQGERLGDLLQFLPRLRQLALRRLPLLLHALNPGPQRRRLALIPAPRECLRDLILVVHETTEASLETLDAGAAARPGLCTPAAVVARLAGRAIGFPI